MDSPECHVIYVNRNAGRDRLVLSKSVGLRDDQDNERIGDDVLPLLEAFGDGAFFPPLERFLLLPPVLLILRRSLRVHFWHSLPR